MNKALITGITQQDGITSIWVLKENATKACKNLHWLPKIKFEDLVVEMANRDLEHHTTCRHGGALTPGGEGR